MLARSLLSCGGLVRSRVVRMGVVRGMASMGGMGGRQPWINPENVPQGESLKLYGRDLTEIARNGKLDPVIGREEQIRRAVQILSRRTKNNPVLIGEPGVGKTAIAEGLAQRIASGACVCVWICW